MAAAAAPAAAGASTLRNLVSVLQHFPPVTYAFAYGSGAHYQPGLYDASEPLHAPSGAPSLGGPDAAAADARQASGVGASASGTGSIRGGPAAAAAARAAGALTHTHGKRPMVDFIFAVHDAHKWHELNLKRNPEHYSWVGRLGANVVCGIAEAVGVGVHFNPYVQLDAQTSIKYGVIEVAALQRDLSYWTHVYVAGRLHKPVTDHVQPPRGLEEALLTNRHHAVATALALLPPTFTEHEFLRTLVGLSYRGDVRLALRAEDPHKVDRIVAGSWDALHDMYLPLLKSQRYAPCELAVVGDTGGAQPGGAVWRQARDPASQAPTLRLLPPGLLHEMAARLGFKVPLEHLHPGESTQAEVVAEAIKSGQAQRLAADSLEAIVRRSSTYQAAAGLLAAGGGKAVQYVAAKVAKAARPLLGAAQSSLEAATKLRKS